MIPSAIGDHQARARRAEMARLELGVAASQSERRNRPRFLLAIGVLVVIAGGIYAGMGLSARTAAITKLTKDRASLSQLKQLIQDLRDLRNKEGQRGFNSDPTVAAKLESLAKRFDLKPLAPVSDTDSGRDSGSGTNRLVEKKYSVRFANQDPKAVFDWLQATQPAAAGQVVEIPGLEIARMSVRPGAMGSSGEGAWSIDIDFTRWEKRR